MCERFDSSNDRHDSRWQVNSLWSITCNCRSKTKQARFWRWTNREQKRAKREQSERWTESRESRDESNVMTNESSVRKRSPNTRSWMISISKWKGPWADWTRTTRKNQGARKWPEDEWRMNGAADNEDGGGVQSNVLASGREDGHLVRKGCTAFESDLWLESCTMRWRLIRCTLRVEPNKIKRKQRNQQTWKSNDEEEDLKKLEVPGAWRTSKCANRNFWFGFALTISLSLTLSHSFSFTVCNQRSAVVARINDGDEDNGEAQHVRKADGQMQHVRVKEAKRWWWRIGRDSAG